MMMSVVFFLANNAAQQNLHHVVYKYGATALLAPPPNLCRIMSLRRVASNKYFLG